MVAVAFSLLGGAGWQFLDNSGNVLSGGRLYTYQAGGSTPAATYADSSGNVSNGVYVELDSAGRPSAGIWLLASQDYKFVVKKYVSPGVYSDIRTYDNIPGAASNSVLTQFIADLASAEGAGLVGFSHAETYTSATVGRKLQQVIDPRDAPYSATADGSTNDAAALTAAINAAALLGAPVDGGGETYAVSGDLSFSGVDGIYLRNISLVQLTPNNSSRRTLFFTNCDNLRLEKVYVDRNGNGTFGSLGDAAGIWIAGGDNVQVDGVEVTGDDKGSGLAVLSTTNSDIRNVYVHDMAYDNSSATDDQVQGIWFNANSQLTASSLHVSTLTGNGSGSFPNRYTRGIIASGNLHCAFTGWTVEAVDQGFDLSGSAGNEDCTIADFTVENVTTWGVKLANSQVRCVVNGGTVKNAGLAGVVVSGPSESGLTNKCSDNTISDVLVVNPGYNAFPGNNAAFLIAPGVFDTDFPKGIKIQNCVGIDVQTVPTMDHVVRNEVASVTSSRLNEAIDIRGYGWTVAFSNGMNFNICQVNGDTNVSIPNATWTALNWPGGDLIDGAAMHSVSVNNNVITVKQAGIYLICYNIAFAANATGNRGVKIMKGGLDTGGGTTRITPNASDDNYVSNSFVLRLNAGDTVSLEGWQNSGGALNFLRDRSTFSAALLSSVGE